MLAEDVAANRAMAERGADLLEALCGPVRATSATRGVPATAGTSATDGGGATAGTTATGGPPTAEASGAGGLRIHTHCNAGALACVEVGTALGVVRALHARDRLARVYADETRPLLQGAAPHRVGARPTWASTTGSSSTEPAPR